MEDDKVKPTSPSGAEAKAVKAMRGSAPEKSQAARDRLWAAAKGKSLKNFIDEYESKLDSIIRERRQNHETLFGTALPCLDSTPSPRCFEEKPAASRQSQRARRKHVCRVADADQLGDATVGSSSSPVEGTAGSSASPATAASPPESEAHASALQEAEAVDGLAADGLEGPLEVRAPDEPLPAGTTTVSVRNIPAKYSLEQLMDEWKDSSIDLAVLPLCGAGGGGIKTRGYAFLNFSSVERAATFQKKWTGQLLLHNSSKSRPLRILAAPVQGYNALMKFASKMHHGRSCSIHQVAQAAEAGGAASSTA